MDHLSVPPRGTCGRTSSPQRYEFIQQDRRVFSHASKLGYGLNLSIALMTLWAFAMSRPLVGQTTPSDQPPSTDSSTSAPSPQDAPSQATPLQIPPAQAVDRPVSWKQLFPNVVSDQERIWSFPARLAHGKDLIPTIAVVGATAGLLALDPTEGSYFRNTSSFHTFNNVFSSNATIYGTIAVPVSLYAIGFMRKDAKMEQTALLAGEAVADAEILTEVFKVASQRTRPSGFPVQGNFYDSWFEKGTLSGSGGGFPSGHTIAAFSVATIIARRYGNHRWVPFVAYGAAALVGFSRLSLSAHFTSDVFVGGVLGYSISRFTVLQQ
jgi:membrane-associated phospholipid phosphatase